jgi:hypothetical protein
MGHSVKASNFIIGFKEESSDKVLAGIPFADGIYANVVFGILRYDTPTMALACRLVRSILALY